METIKGRPVIKNQDHPLTIERALQQSFAYWGEHMPPEEARRWAKIASDATDTLKGHFSLVDEDLEIPHGEVLNPEGKATLYLTPDELELALVAYGYNLLEKSGEHIPEELVKVDFLLKEIDEIKARHNGQ